MMSRSDVSATSAVIPQIRARPRAVEGAFASRPWHSSCLIQGMRGSRRIILVLRTLLLALLLTSSAVAPHLQADDALAMTITPTVAIAPANLHVQIRIEPSTENRRLSLSADSARFYRSSEVQLDGDQAPRILVFDFRNVPGGSYEIHGALFDGHGQERGCARHTVRIMSSAQDP